jgi:6-phosphogluconolactonase
MKAPLRLLLSVFVLVGLSSPSFRAGSAQSRKDQLVYIGTYTRDTSKGIYAFRLDSTTGKLTPLGLAAETVNPSFLALHPNRRFLYSANEIDTFEGRKSGAVTSFAVDSKTGKLTLLNAVASGGSGSCYVAVDPSGRNVLVANYGGGSVAALPIGADGKLHEASGFIQHAGAGADPGRQGGPHAHSINVSADNRFAIAADLGLDQLLVYRFDPERGTLAPNAPPFTKLAPGAGPRHFAFHPGRRYGYVINELKSTVTALAYDASRGAFREIQTVTTLPEGFQGKNFTAEVQVHPSGAFLYGSNRGHDSIAVFAIDPATGSLTAVEHVPTGGKTPRNFGIDLTGSFLIAANQDSGSLVVFRIDKKTGRLTATGERAKVGFPVCVKFIPLD